MPKLPSRAARRILLLALLAAPIVRAQAPPVAGSWDDRFGRQTSPLPGIPGVYGAFFDGEGRLTLYGGIPSAGGVQANGIVRWTGTRWLDLGDPSFLRANAAAEGGGVLAAAVQTGTNQTPTLSVQRRATDAGGWASLGTYTGTLQRLAVSAQGRLCAAGAVSFTAAAAAPVVACHDGGAWTPLGPAFEAASASVGFTGLAFLPDGSLVATGRFSRASGVVVNGIARWNGTAWEPLGSGLPGIGVAQAVAVSAGGKATSNPDGGPVAGDGVVVEPSGAVVVSYKIPSDAGVSVARFDGTAWTRLESPHSGSYYAAFNANTGPGLVAEPGGTLLFVSNATVAPGSVPSDAPLTGWAARWDGTRWSEARSPGASTLTSGNPPETLLLRADGWRVALGGSVTGAAPTNQNALYATAPGTPVGAAGDAAAWLPLGLGLGNQISGLTRGGPGNAIHAVSARNRVSSVFRWAGADWAPLGPAFTCSAVCALGDLAVAPDGTAYLTLTGSGNSRPAAAGTAGVLRWDGTAWTPLAAGTPSPTASRVVVGADGRPVALFQGGTGDAGVFRWDGAAWARLGTIQATQLTVAPDGTLYANPLGVRTSAAARWTGATWDPVGPAPPASYAGTSRLYAGRTTGRLYAQFGFSYSSSNTDTALYVLDGGAWRFIGAPSGATATFNRFVTDVSEDDQGRLYAVGTFERILTAPPPAVPPPGSAVDALQVARWDGTTWAPVGTGLYFDATQGTTNGVGLVNEVDVDGTDVWVAGFFHRTAEGAPAEGLTRWRLSGATAGHAAPPGLPERGLALAIAGPNPTRGALRLRATVDAAGPLDLRLYDVLGREVVRQHDAGGGPGEALLSLDVSGLVPGVYVARVTSNGASASVRFTLAR